MRLTKTGDTIDWIDPVHPDTPPVNLAAGGIPVSIADRSKPCISASLSRYLPADGLRRT